MEAAAVQIVAKYLFFSSLDEQLSFTAGLSILGELRARNLLHEHSRAHWVRLLHKWKMKPQFLKAQPMTGASAFILPGDLSLATWGSFMASGEESEVEAVLLSQILGFTDEEIAAGLDTTIGTVRYRVGKGLRYLGGFIES